jgi:hypothetical protein
MLADEVIEVAITSGGFNSTFDKAIASSWPALRSYTPEPLLAVLRP